MDGNIGIGWIFLLSVALLVIAFQTLYRQFAVQRTNDDLPWHWLDGSIHDQNIVG